MNCYPIHNFLLDYIQGSLFDLEKNSLDVFTYDSQGKKLEASKQDDDKQQCGKARWDVMVDILPDNRHDKIDSRSADAQYTQQDQHFDGYRRKIKDAIQCELDKFVKRILGASGRASTSFVLQPNLIESNPTSNSAKEPALFAVQVYRFRDATCYHSEIARVLWDGVVGYMVKKSVEKIIRTSF